MTDPLVTIGITVYNARDSLVDAIKSALHQTWVNTEIVAVDDCSIDGSFHLLKDLEKKIPKLRVYQNNRNGGVAVSRNRIIAEAHGDFLAFFDDDDISHPERVELQVREVLRYESLYANGKIVVCHTDREKVYSAGPTSLERTMKSHSQIAPHGIEVAKYIVMGSSINGTPGACATCSQLARLSSYRFLGGFDESFRRSEDTELNVRIAKAGGHFVGISRPLVQQKMTGTSEKSVQIEMDYFSHLVEKHQDLFPNESLLRFSLSWLKLKGLILDGKYFQGFRCVLKLSISNPRETCRRIISCFPGLRSSFAVGKFLREAAKNG